MEQILKDVFAVEVPQDADPNEWKIFNVDGKSYLNGLTEDGEMYAGLDPLPPGSYEILFTTKVFNDNQAASVVAIKEANGYPIGYKDYENDDESYFVNFNYGTDRTGKDT